MPRQQEDTSPEAIAQFLEEVNKQLEEDTKPIADNMEQIEEGMLHADPFGDHGEVTHSDAQDQGFKNDLDAVAASMNPTTPPPLPMVKSDTRTDAPADEPALVEAVTSPSEATKTLQDTDLTPKDGAQGTFTGDAAALGINSVTDLPNKICYNGDCYARLHMTTQGSAVYLSETGPGKIEICGVG